MSLGVHGGLPVNGKGANDVSRTGQRHQACGDVRARAQRADGRVRRQRRTGSRPHAAASRSATATASCYRRQPGLVPGRTAGRAVDLGDRADRLGQGADHDVPRQPRQLFQLRCLGDRARRPGWRWRLSGQRELHACRHHAVACWVFDLVFAPGGYAIVGRSGVRVLQLGRGHQHGRAARERRCCADHRQARRHDGACRKSSASCAHPPTTSASRATTPRTAPAASTQRAPCSL